MLACLEHQSKGYLILDSVISFATIRSSFFFLSFSFNYVQDRSAANSDLFVASCLRGEHYGNWVFLHFSSDKTLHLLDIYAQLVIIYPDLKRY